ncbi:MAG: hypothetical protein J3Q66DRAFT_330115 [Benniella sp.]|nr:MAG: hypothetical protein J3Q66DRAFT_330115 [Benniella sp.]
MIDQPSTTHNSTNALRLVAPYLPSKELTRVIFVCRSWSRALLPQLWWNAIQHIDPLFERFCRRIASQASEPQELLSNGLLQETSDFIRMISQHLQKELVRDPDALQGLTVFKSNSCMGLEILAESGWGKNVKQLWFAADISYSNQFWYEFQPERDRWQAQRTLTTLASLVGSAPVKDLTMNIGMLGTPGTLRWHSSNQVNVVSTLTSLVVRYSTVQIKYLEEFLEDNPNLISLKFYGPDSDYRATDPPPPRPSFHNNLKSLYAESGSMLQSVFWFFLGCSTVLQSVRLEHVRITDGPPTILPPQTFRTITSLFMDGLHLHRTMLRILLASCPGLEELEMHETYIHRSEEEEDGGGPSSSVFPTIAAEIDFTSPTTAPEQSFLPNLRVVVFKYLRDSSSRLFVFEQIEFLRWLPALESVRVFLDSFPSHREMTDLTNNGGFGKVKDFELNLHALRPHTLPAIFQLVPKCTSIRFPGVQLENYAMFPRLHPTQVEKWRRGALPNDQALMEGEIFRKYSQSLEHLHFNGQVPLSASTLLPVLQFCRRLKHLDGTGTTILKCTLENMKTPWVCKELETLKIFLDCGGTDEAKNQDDSELIGIDKVTEDFVLTQRALFTRLAQLTNLRTLVIWQGGNNPGVDLSLKTGLGLLAPLKRLEELDVRQSTSEAPLWLEDEIVYRICDNMDVEDATWIAEHWCMLKVVRGITWFIPEGVQTLKRLLTTQHGVEFMEK